MDAWRHSRSVGTGLVGITVRGWSDIVTRRQAPVTTEVGPYTAKAKLGAAPRGTKLSGTAVLSSSWDGEETKERKQRE
jgi:hypothetical protein